MRKKTLYLSHAAFIAALYVVLNFVSMLFGLSNGVVQLRLSEILTVLPMFTPAAIPGVFVGCLIANILSGCVIYDIVFGSIATLLGAIFTRKLKNFKALPFLSPIFFNTLIIPFVLRFAYGAKGSVLFFIFTVAISEILSCGVLGSLLVKILKTKRIF